VPALEITSADSMQLKPKIFKFSAKKFCDIMFQKYCFAGMKILCSYIIHGYQKTVDKYEVEIEKESNEEKV